MRRIYTLLFTLGLLSIFVTGAKAQVAIPAPSVTGTITVATTNATCTVPGATSAGSVDQQLSSTNGSVGISLTGTWAATINIQGSVDHGKTWTALTTPFTANQQAIYSTTGYSDVCVFASPFTSGTATVTFATSSGTATGSATGTSTNSSQIQGCGPADAAATCNPVVVGGVDAAGNVQELPVADTGTAVPDKAVLVGTYDGTNIQGALNCPNTSTFSVVSTVTQVIAASGSTKIRICSFDINPATITAGTTDLVYGTGTNCGTGTTTLTGAYTLPAAAVVDITPSTLSASSPLTAPASQAVCVRAVTSTVNGFIVWEQH
jgi:hypothetical protein